MSMVLQKIAGIPVRELAERFGTPLYVYDRSVIEERIKQLHQFPTIRYAQKACSNIAILSLMRKLGVVVDATTVGEVHRALAAGYKPEQIVYTSDILDTSALEMIRRLNVGINCGSSDMIRQAGEASPGRGLILRINPGFGHGHSQKTNTGGEGSKHGIWHEQIDHCLVEAKAVGAKIVGIHMHIGSGSDFDHLTQVCSAMESVAVKAAENLQIISAGGGLPTPYRPGDKHIDIDRYAKMWLSVRDRLQQKLGKSLHLEVEPGRFLVAESGYLLAEIRAIKKQKDTTFYVVNAGFNNLVRPAMYGSYHPISLSPRESNATLPEQAAVVAGPLCESGDIFTQAEGGFVETRSLPGARIGDWLVIHCAGAYGFSMASNYNSMPLAAEVLVSDGKPLLIRERQSLDDLIRGESIPAELG